MDSIASFQERVGLDLTKSPVTYYPSFLEQAHSGTLNSIKLNTASEGNHNDVNQGMPAGLVLDQLELLDNKMIKFSLLLISNPYDYISSGVFRICNGRYSWQRGSSQS